MKTTKRILMAAMGVTMAMTTVLAGCGGKPASTVAPKDETKTQLYVTTRDAGVGVEWLKTISKMFEDKYEEVSFQTGKKGVQVYAEGEGMLNSKTLLESMGKMPYNVIISEGVRPQVLQAQGLVADMTDVVTGTMNFDKVDVNGEIVSIGESKTIESIMYDEQKATLNIGGSYYGAPWGFAYAGITYDEKVWQLNKLYFAEDKDDAFYMEDTISSYTGKTYTGRGFIQSNSQPKSVGPDGVRGSYDDGMPSSYEEFMYLCDYMAAEKGLAPLIITGVNNNEYTNKFVNAFAVALAGKEDFLVNFDSQTKKGNTVDIVTGFDGNTPIIEPMEINAGNGYLMAQSAAKYYAYDLLDKVLVKNEETYLSEFSGLTSHTDTQAYFVKSGNQTSFKRIGMIVEGSYWYNEAKSSIESTGDGTNSFKAFPIPRQLTGSVEEGKGTPFTVADELGMNAVINANTTDPDLLNLAKLFVRFAYTDECLATFIECNSQPVMLKYQLPTARYNALSTYAKSQIDVYENAVKDDAFVWPISTSTAYKKNASYYGLIHNSDFWKSSTYGYAYNAFATGKSVKEFFLDTKISQETWQKDFM